MKKKEKKSNEKNVKETKKENPEITTQEVESKTEELRECEDKINTLQKQLDEANDKFLRLFSEFDNFRKRAAKERVELTKTASESVITALLPVLDDLERAVMVDAGDSETEEQAKKEGIYLILNKFKSVLRQKGVEEITSVGEVFNTDYHDAITHIPAESKEQKGKVVEEVKKGYMLNGKVIRYASVIVAN